MLIFGIGGVCAVGKTKLMKYVLKKLGRGKVSKVGIFVYQIYSEKKCIVLGSYAKAGFAGTDRLSMAVQPVALGVIQAWASDPFMKDWVILFEGDRLFNSSFLNSLEKIPSLDYYWIMLEASPETQAQRHKDRNDTQSEKWLKGRITKAANLRESLKDLKILKNETREDLENNVKYVLETTGLDKR